jgi:3,4-dihydroxy 2-butanone 4-phosphate synthase/GTP cyclohydrolase II
MALAYIQKHGGCIIYLQQEGRGIGLANKIAAYALQDDGLDTVDANLHLGFPEDSREYGVVPSILADMKIGSIQLMTNNPRKVERLSSLGVNVERTLPMVVPKINPFNRKYMETKQERMNHANLSALFTPPTSSSSTSTAAATATDEEPASVGGEEMVRGNANGQMAPSRQTIASQYINNGTEFGANAVQVSLTLSQEEELDDASEAEEEEAAGVTASDDGYCFGKESVVEAIEAVGRGEMVVVVDDMDRENEGDFIMAADQCTALDMAQIVRYSSGVVCVAMEGDRMEALNLPPMLTNNEDPKGTAFSVTVDATKEHGITTGISAMDRAITIRMLADPASTAVDFNRPGHLFPLRARAGGVLERDGHTEASVDLARLAGCSPVGVLCEIVSEENPIEMMRLPEIKRFCKQHGYVLTSIVDIAQYRRETGQ